MFSWFSSGFCVLLVLFLVGGGVCISRWLFLLI